MRTEDTMAAIAQTMGSRGLSGPEQSRDTTTAKNMARRARAFMLCAVALLVIPTMAFGQETIGAGKVELDSALLGGGLLLFPSNGAQPPHGYVFDFAAAANLTRRIGVEGDLAWAMSRRQTLALSGAGPIEQHSPNMLFYSANVILNPIGHVHRLVPYAELGAGALTVLAAPSTFGIAGDTTHLAVNLGAGLRWFIIPHWGVRGDYRYVVITGVPDSAIVGVVPIRHAQRLYGALVLTF
jgi:opacity protein-like surface antigen